MTEPDLFHTQVEAMITQIEDMLQHVASKNLVESSYVQDGLLDLLNIVYAIDR